MRMIISREAGPDAGAPTGLSNRHAVRDKIPSMNGRKLADTYRDNIRFYMARYHQMITQSTETGGDNASRWDFLRISVAQVLSLGLSGISISGADVGGFEPSSEGEQWASPELLMRWYCAYSLLPWFR